jgi:hypothetical protein
MKHYTYMLTAIVLLGLGSFSAPAMAAQDDSDWGDVCSNNCFHAWMPIIDLFDGRYGEDFDIALCNALARCLMTRCGWSHDSAAQLTVRGSCAGW